MAGRVMLNPWIYGRSGRNPRRTRRNMESWEILTPQEEQDLSFLWHISRVPVSGGREKGGRGSYARRLWASGEMAKKHPSRSSTAYYKIYERRGLNPRRSRRRNLPLTVFVGRKRHTRSALIKKFGAFKGAQYWRRAKTKYHGYGKFGARCRTRRRRLNPVFTILPDAKSAREHRRRPQIWKFSDAVSLEDLQAMIPKAHTIRYSTPADLDKYAVTIDHTKGRR